MNWEAVGAFAELLGAFGVIVSLVYLATQIRQNTRSVRGATYQGFLANTQSNQTQLAYDRETSEIVRRGMQDHRQLDEAEAFRFNWFMGTIFYSCENAMYQHRQGMLTDDRWQAQVEILKFYLEAPGIRTWWSSYPKNTLDDEFVRLIDEAAGSAEHRQQLSTLQAATRLR